MQLKYNNENLINANIENWMKNWLMKHFLNHKLQTTIWYWLTSILGCCNKSLIISIFLLITALYNGVQLNKNMKFH